jgi:hypothetical protein
MSGRWREEQTTKLVNMYKDSKNLWNVFTPEYINREARLASLEHMGREMNIYRSRPVELVYCLSNSWHRVNNNGQSNCLSSSSRPVGSLVLLFSFLTWRKK